jgi:hypothetical protein
MSIRNALGLVSTLALVGTVVACSSSDDSSNTPATAPTTPAATPTTPPKKDPAPNAGQGTTPAKDAGSSATTPEPQPEDKCTPGSVTSFKYTAPAKSKAFGQNACTAANVDTFVESCLANTATEESCADWKKANAACGACMATSNAEVKGTGPFFEEAGQVTGVNIEGCLDQYKAGCGPKYAEFAGCLGAACNNEVGGNCDGAADSDVEACQQGAVQGPCRARTQAVVTGCKGALAFGGQGDSPGEACFPGQGEDQLDWIKRFALMFCGPKTDTATGGTTTDAGRP